MPILGKRTPRQKHQFKAAAKAVLTASACMAIRHKSKRIATEIRARVGEKNHHTITASTNVTVDVKNAAPNK